jgi:cyanate lyase
MTVEEQKYVTALEEYKQLADEQMKQLNRIIDLNEKMVKMLEREIEMSNK